MKGMAIFNQRPIKALGLVVFLGALIALTLTGNSATLERAGQDGAGRNPGPAFTFGSQAILKACWSDMELAGSPNDKKISIGVKTDWEKPRLMSPAHPSPPLPPDMRNSIRSVKPAGNQKLVAITFDLCERQNEVTGYDGEIVNYLRAHQVKATFFAGGKWMATHPEKAMQLMADPLFELGNHRWDHKNFRHLTSPEIEKEVLATQAQYEFLREKLQLKPGAMAAGPEEMQKIPRAPGIFRFPYGTCNSDGLDFLARHGLAAVQWSLVTGDPFKKQTADLIVQTVLKLIKSGDIIICHANGRGHHTAKALPVLIPKLRNLNYQFVTVSELLASGEVVSSKDCYTNKPGDNARYDRIF